MPSKPCKNHPERESVKADRCLECEAWQHRYWNQLRRGASPEDAAAFASRVRGICAKCGDTARTKASTICLKCDHAERKRRSAASREKAVPTDRKCVKCGAKFMDRWRSSECNKCRYRNKKRNPGKKPRPPKLPKPVPERWAHRKPPEPKQEPLPPPPANFPITRIPAVIPDFQSYKNR